MELEKKGGIDKLEELVNIKKITPEIHQEVKNLYFALVGLNDPSVTKKAVSCVNQFYQRYKKEVENA